MSSDPLSPKPAYWLSNGEHDQFTHEPLNLGKGELRLLRLHHKTGPHALVRCSLVTCNLEVKPNYVALSYMWGPPYPSQDIEVDGRRLSVRQNLYNFLVTQHSDVSCGKDLLWIDQICINQEDPRERSHQVAQMAQIYRDAREVHIWLDIQPSDIPELLQPRRSSFGFQSLAAAQLNNEPEVLDKWKDLSYWNRLWIMQEVLLARSLYVIVGRHRRDWKQLFEMFYDIDCPIRSLGLARHRGRAAGSFKWTWQDAYWASHGTKCEDTRDKMYGLLGLIDPNFAIQPDYVKTLQEVFSDLVHAEARAVKHDFVTWKWVCDMWREELNLPEDDRLSEALFVHIKTAAGLVEQAQEPPRVIPLS